MRLLFPLGLTVLIAACGSTEPTTDSVLASVVMPAYTRPATISARITNNSSELLFSGQCLRFQRLLGDAWVDAPPETVCASVRVELRAGSTGGASGYLGAGAAPGRYRGVAVVDSDAGTSLVLLTDAFTLQ